MRDSKMTPQEGSITLNLPRHTLENLQLLVALSGITAQQYKSEDDVDFAQAIGFAPQLLETWVDAINNIFDWDEMEILESYVNAQGNIEEILESAREVIAQALKDFDSQ